jgi:hypothetical protein
MGARSRAAESSEAAYVVYAGTAPQRCGVTVGGTGGALSGAEPCKKLLQRGRMTGMTSEKGGSGVRRRALGLSSRDGALALQAKAHQTSCCIAACRLN